MCNKVETAFNERSDRYSLEMDWITHPRYIDCFAYPVIKGGRLLDAGTGNGIVAKYCADAGWNVTAIDISKEMLRGVPSGITTLIQNVETIDFADDEFDVAVCRQVLHYTNIEKALLSLLRVTKKELRLGHLHFVSKSDEEFWRDFFSIAAPQRKMLFFYRDNVIENILRKHKADMVIIKQELRLSDVLVSQQRFPDKSVYEALMNKLRLAPEEFLTRNNIVFNEDGTVYSDRYWEYLRCILEK